MRAPRDFDLPDIPVLIARPVAVMRCAQRLHHEAPRQARTRPDGTAPGDCTGQVVVRQGMQNMLHDLGSFSHVWLLFACHLARGYRDVVTPPRDTKQRGLFATRAPNRPNSIGLSAVRLLGIAKRVLLVGDHDLLDGTPILDIKPYVARYDAIPDACAGWVEEVAPDASDHRRWWNDKGKPPPRIYRERGCV
jgi:tRNA-Thr(GGU) m(6)t(6)A37 methyltransferase TsaA